MFGDIMREEAAWTMTENGAACKNTTGSFLLDFFASIGSMRTREEEEIIQKFELAYQEEPLRAVKCVFYARDIRMGLGERRIFRLLLPYIADHYPEVFEKNRNLIGYYGRFDDFYCLIDTKAEKLMWETVKEQLAQDEENRKAGKPCSLLAKWLKKADASSPNTKKLGIYTAKKLGMTVYDYKRVCNRLRKYIDVVEQRMSAQDWQSIAYDSVPSRAMLNYRNAFYRHDEARFSAYLEKVVSGEAKLHSDTLYPYDIVEKVLYQQEKNTVLDAQWNVLPNYVEEGSNAVVMADVSGSMWGRPMATSIGLAIYFAERNLGAYHNLFMTFSKKPELVEVKGNTITEKVHFLSKAYWEMNTDLEAALLKILELGVEHQCPKEEMPKTLIVISDMEIDSCTGQRHREQFYDYAARRFSEEGYEIPNVVFWNVSSRHDVFLADKNRKGVQLLSGQSVSVFRSLMQTIGKTPLEMMYLVLDTERYQPVTIG